MAKALVPDLDEEDDAFSPDEEAALLVAVLRWRLPQH
jgi:hypothetical protein